jgi:hypothetical protein
MPALVAGIHVFAAGQRNEDVDGRDEAPRAQARGDPDEPGHDAELVARYARNISGSKQLHAGRQRQSAGQALHFLLHDRFGFAARVGMRRYDQILDDLRLVRLEQ